MTTNLTAERMTQIFNFAKSNNIVITSVDQLQAANQRLAIYEDEQANQKKAEEQQSLFIQKLTNVIVASKSIGGFYNRLSLLIEESETSFKTFLQSIDFNVFLQNALKLRNVEMNVTINKVETLSQQTTPKKRLTNLIENTLKVLSNDALTITELSAKSNQSKSTTYSNIIALLKKGKIVEVTLEIPRRTGKRGRPSMIAYKLK